MTADNAYLPIHFILSSPRSGTRWLNQALNQHPAIFATENRLFGNFCDLWPASDGTLRPRITFDHYARAFSGHFEYAELGMNRNQFLRSFQRFFYRNLIRYSLSHCEKKVMIDKITPYHGTSEKVLDSIKQFFPEASLVQLVRDGRDVATSGGFDWLLKDAQGTDRYAFFVEHRPNIVLRRFFDDELLRVWAKYWVEPIAALQNCDVPRVVVRYEEMKVNQAQVIQRICDHLKIECTPAQAELCSQNTSFEKMTGRKPGDADQLSKARKGIVGDWRSYFTRRDGSLFQELTGNKLIELGYETDQKWFESLPETLDLAIA